MKLINDGIKTMVLLVLATLIAYVFYIMSQTATNIAIVYVMFIVIIARNTSGYRWGIIASLIGVVAVNYFFTDPVMVVDFEKNGYPITFLGMLVISLITGTTTAHLKERSRIVIERGEVLNRLNEINKQLLTAESVSQIQDIVVAYISRYTNCTVGFFIDPKDEQQSIAVKERNGGDSELFWEEKEKERRSQLSMEKGICRDDELERSRITYFPLISHNIVWGIIGVVENSGEKMNADVCTFLKLMASQIALALERQRLLDTHQELVVNAEKEKMRSNLLRAISHDLRTPLTGIIGATQACLETEMPKAERNRMLNDIYEDSNWLLNMVENLLSVTRIDEKNASVKKSLEPLEEIMGEALMRIKKRYPSAEIQMSVPEEIVMIAMDPVLIEQVMINLLENAVKYSVSSKPVHFYAKLEGDMVRVAVRDYGKGIEKDRLEHLFDGYIVTGGNQCSDSRKGMGIGLSICKTIITAHGGQIKGKNHQEGVEIYFTLPCEGGEG